MTPLNRTTGDRAYWAVTALLYFCTAAINSWPVRPLRLGAATLTCGGSSRASAASTSDHSSGARNDAAYTSPLRPEWPAPSCPMPHSASQVSSDTTTLRMMASAYSTPSGRPGRLCACDSRMARDSSVPLTPPASPATAGNQA